jgi:Gas vesicle protein K
MKRRKRPRVKRTKKARKPARKPVMRWNPDPDDVQRSVIKLVLTLVELIRKLMERQAIRRMDDRTITAAETEAVGKALMEIERTIREIGTQFDLTPEDLNLDLGTIKLL